MAIDNDQRTGSDVNGYGEERIARNDQQSINTRRSLLSFEVLLRMSSQPITVYIPESEAKQGARWGTRYIPIAEYGTEYLKPRNDRNARKPVRLLYNGSNNYVLLI